MTPLNQPATNEELLAFLEEQLPAERMAEIEQALRDDEELRQRLASTLRQHDPGAHSVAHRTGGQWRWHGRWRDQLP